MDTTQTIYFLLSSLVGTLPQLIVIIGGIIFCFSKLSKNPQAARLALIGLGILLLNLLFGLGFSIIQVQLPHWYRDSYQTIIYINFAMGIFRNIIWSVGLGVLIYAVWAGRGDK